MYDLVPPLGGGKERKICKWTIYGCEKRRGCEKRIVPKKERPRVYNELKVFLSVIINLQ